MSILFLVSMLSNMIMFFTPGLSSQDNTGVKVGSEVPEFTLPDQDGKMFDLKNVLGKQNLVIYFYVRDETPGCTTEACTFRDDYTSFQNVNASVIGISAQSVESHKKFAEKYKLPFTLLSDNDNKVRNLFGVKNGEGSLAGRVTFVVNKQGEIVYIFNSLTKPVQHVTEAMRILKGMS